MTAPAAARESSPLDLRAVWERGVPWEAYLQPGMEHYPLWKGVYDHAAAPDWAVAKAREGPLRKLLVIAADWCGDASNTVPVLARLAEAVEGLELRVIERDRFPEVMDRYLTSGSRSVPIAIGLDAGFRELGHWGPRPSALQTWMLANKAVIPSPRRYLYARRWYAQDHGQSTLRELLAAVSLPV